MKKLMESPVGFTLIGSVIGGMLGFGAHTLSRSMQRKKVENMLKAQHQAKQQQQQQPKLKESERIEIIDENGTQTTTTTTTSSELATFTEKNERVERTERSEEQEKEKEQKERTRDVFLAGAGAGMPQNEWDHAAQQSQKLLEETIHVKRDDELVSMLAVVGKFMLHNPVAYKKALELVDKLYDLQILVYTKTVKAKASYKNKAFRYKSDAYEAFSQLQRDVCTNMNRSPIQIPELEDNLQWIETKLSNMVHNISLEVSERLSQEAAGL